MIPDLIAKWREGYEVVYAVRAEREGRSWFKLFTASLFYRLIYRITDVDIPLDTGDFRLLDRKVVNVLNQMRERHRFLRGMSSWVGFRQIGVPYKRARALRWRAPSILSRKWLSLPAMRSPVFPIFLCKWQPIWAFFQLGSASWQSLW